MPCASKPGDDAGQHVAGARGREPGRRILVDRGAAIGRRHDGVGALEQDDCAGGPRGRARCNSISTYFQMVARDS